MGLIPLGYVLRLRTCRYRIVTAGVTGSVTEFFLIFFCFFTVKKPGNKKVDVVFDDFTIKTDQKKIYGGDNTAPEPFNIFFSSLASCAGIYAVSFCDTRKLETSGMNLILEAVFKRRTIIYG